MQQELKILKHGGWIYIAEKNTGKDQECCMEGNMGHCYLACHGCSCPLNCKDEHYRIRDYYHAMEDYAPDGIYNYYLIHSCIYHYINL